MSPRPNKRLGANTSRKPPAQQVGALCIDPGTGKVLLITSRGTGRWVIPKGWPMEGRSLAGAALQEAWEEAGMRGAISEKPIGSFGYDKILPRGSAIPVEVSVFVLRVDHIAKNYPERLQRHRKWFKPERAAKMVDEPGLKKLLRKMARNAKH